MPFRPTFAALAGTLLIALSISIVAPSAAMADEPLGANAMLSTRLAPKNATVYSGDSLVYEANLSCSQSSACLDVALHFSPPAGATPDAIGTVSTSATGATVTSNADGSVDVLLASVDAGVSTQLSISWPTRNYLTVPGIQETRMTVSQPGYDPHELTAAIDLVAESAMTLQKTGAAQTRAGENYNYLIYYGLTSPDPGEDHGALAFLGVSVVDPLPVEATFVSASHGGIYDPGTHTVTWNLGTLTTPGTLTATVTFADEHDHAILNTATLSGYQLGVWRTWTLSSSSLVEVADVPAVVNVSSRKEGDPVIGGRDHEFRFVLTNYGNSTVDLVVSDPIPDGLDVTSVDRGYYVDEVSTGSTVEFIYADGTSSGPVDFDVDRVDVPAGAPRVVRVEFTLSRVGVGLSVSPTITSTPDWDAIGSATTITNCAEIAPVGGAVEQRCSTVQVSPVPVPDPSIRKTTSQAPVAPGETLTWELTLDNTSATTAWMPLLIDDIPNELSLIEGSFRAADTNPGYCPATDEFGEELLAGWDAANGTPFTSGARDVSVRWTYLGDTGVFVPHGWNPCVYRYDTVVKPGAASGSYNGDSFSLAYRGNLVTAYDRDARVPLDSADWLVDRNDTDGDGDTTERAPSAGSSFTLADAAGTWIEKEVSGDADGGAWFGSAERIGDAAEVATATPGGTVSYRVRIGNIGNRDLRNLVAYDLLPAADSPGVTSSRYAQAPMGAGNEWTPTMTGPITSTDPTLQITYSVESDPCRPEMDTTTDHSSSLFCGGAQDTSWMTADEVVDWSAIRAIRFDFGSRVFDGGEFEQIEWTMAVPTTLTNGATAIGGERTWNRVAMQAVQVHDGSPLLAAEAPWVVAQLGEPIPTDVLTPTLPGSDLRTERTGGLTATGDPGGLPIVVLLIGVVLIGGGAVLVAGRFRRAAARAS